MSLDIQICHRILTLEGGDGERLYFDGSAMVLCNGQVLAQSPQFSLNEVDVVTATVDLEEVRAYRSSISRALQAARSTKKYHRIQAPLELGPDDDDDLNLHLRPTPPREPKFHSVEEEVALCIGCYLWDYMSRSKSAGYLAPLSGGLDSCATTVGVFSMCRLVISALNDGNQSVINTIKRLFADVPLPTTPQEVCNRVLHTIYMGMSKQSSHETRQRAQDLSSAMGSYHINLDIDSVYHAQKDLIKTALGFDVKFRVEGGSDAENLTLQNIQARTRMVTAYEFAQILPTTRKLASGLLVLGSANVAEALVGYYTKYDCSSADINPIGAIDKSDLKRFLAWAQVEYDLPCLEDFLTATPTAELEPIVEVEGEDGKKTTYVQSDEADIGLTYAEMTVFGRLRKERKMGPLSMFQYLVHVWGKDRDKTPDDQNPSLEPAEIARKVKLFTAKHAITRHKSVTLTAGLHCNDYSPDDNRFDMRPFLYPSFWSSWSFKRIDAELARMEKARGKA